MTQVARAAGVSVMTVSYSYSRPERVSASTRERVFAVAEELGYAGPDPSARSLRYGSTRALGLVLGEHLTYAFEDPQASSFLAGIAEVCADEGFGLFIVPITGAPDDGERVSSAAVDAFIVWTTADDDPVLDAVARSRRPVVIHGGPAREDFTLVSIDNRAAARAIGLEIFAGAQHPAVLSFPLGRSRDSFTDCGVDPASALFPVTRERLEGYRDAATELGIAWDSVRVAVSATNSAVEARELAASLLADGVDAIAAMSDQQAVGVLEAGRVRVSGWDDSAEAHAHDLTTVAQDLRAQGVASARIALGLDARRDSEWHIVRRASTETP